MDPNPLTTAAAVTVAAVTGAAAGWAVERGVARWRDRRLTVDARQALAPHVGAATTASLEGPRWER